MFIYVAITVLIAVALLFAIREYVPPRAKTPLAILVLVLLAWWLAWYFGVPMPKGWRWSGFR